MIKTERARVYMSFLRLVNVTHELPSPKKNDVIGLLSYTLSHLCPALFDHGHRVEVLY